MGIVSIVSAPLLWIRLPFAKWGGVIASLLMGSIPVILFPDQGFTFRDGLMVLAFLLIAFWFYRIDYKHRFPVEEANTEE